MNDTRLMGVMPDESFWDAALEKLQLKILEKLQLKIKELEQQNKADLKLLADWLMSLGFSTGHGDTVKDLIAEADWQIKQIKLKIAALESGRDYLSGEYEILQKKNNELEQQLAQEREARIRYENKLFAIGAMSEPPCFVCGYNGEGYFNAQKHSCAERHHRNQ